MAKSYGSELSHIRWPKHIVTKHRNGNEIYAMSGNTLTKALPIQTNSATLEKWYACQDTVEQEKLRNHDSKHSRDHYGSNGNSVEQTSQHN